MSLYRGRTQMKVKTSRTNASDPDFFSIAELAKRWRVSRGTVYTRLRATGAQVLDFAAAGKRGRKVVSARVVFGIEEHHTKRLC